MATQTGRKHISRVSDQNGVSLLYIMLEVHHSGREPLICSRQNTSSLALKNRQMTWADWNREKKPKELCFAGHLMSSNRVNLRDRDTDKEAHPEGGTQTKWQPTFTVKGWVICTFTNLKTVITGFLLLEVLFCGVWELRQWMQRYYHVF